MPVNKLWIEHTERAAWETVQALRKKLVEAEARIQSMAPSASGWRELFDALDAARQQQALEGATYADLIQGLLRRLADAQARTAAMTEELARFKNLGLPAMAASRAPARFDDAEAAYLRDAEPYESESEHFLHAVEHRCRSLLREPGSADLDGVLRAIDARVDSLSDTDDPGIVEAAVELAALGACLAVVARRNARNA